MENICYRTQTPLCIDGRLEEDAWKKAPWSHRFVDVIGGTPALYDSRAAVLWDDRCLYVGFWAEEPYPTATITQRDGYLWFENDLEVFIAGEDTYYEFQISARNTVYEVFYIWTDAYQSGGWSSRPEFDVVKNNARVFGGNHDRQGTYFWNGDHPRGTRWAFLNWDMPGMRSAVSVEGFLNDPSRPSKGWYAEIAFPWEGMRDLAGGRSLPPKDGDVWSLFLGRYNNLPLNGGHISVGWSWDPVGSDDNHRPEAFTRFRFSQEYVEDL
ncbi:MAG TPA: carbohydrate-binding family 9-like protein [Candidatus Faecousia intestinavium]|nr:carbohydrate-binding family 9-like protein [Candidatus Faecousia intestinavium]